MIPRSTELPLVLLVASFLFGCEGEAKKESAAAAPSASAAAAAPTPTPTPTPPPPPKPREDCPEGSSGIGTSAEPCKGSGDARMMEVKWTGKTTDEGPKFQVTNKTKKSILFGSVAAYFYDKAGKQLQVTHGGKPRPMQICSGNIFAGAVKPEEKIFVFFSCVKKDHVPEGTATIEAEAKTVGFSDESGEKNEYYWSNLDLVPDERPKGGLKAKGKKK
ncbi:MAG TPA: hypothetical protein VGK73_20770 [Polyangiaceae bacterium]